MIEEDLDIAIKVVIVGNGAVGKSSMIQRYCKGIFTKDYKKTIGVDFLERQIYVEGEDVRLMLWDTAGQEEFDAITKAYYRGAQSCVVAFSLTDRRSFEAVETWLSKVVDEIGEGVPTTLVMNKMDLAGSGAEQVTPEEAEALAAKLGLPLYRVSVKNDLNVDKVFHFLTEKYLEAINNGDGNDDDDFDGYVPSSTAMTSKMTTSNHLTSGCTNDDPWNRPSAASRLSTTSSTASSKSPRNIPTNRVEESAPNSIRKNGPNLTKASTTTSTKSTTSPLVGDDQFMMSNHASSTTTSSSSQVPQQSRPRWKFKRKKKELGNSSSMNLGGGGGGATIVLAPSKRRTKAKKESMMSCAVL